jgi:hypothetical protein
VTCHGARCHYPPRNARAAAKGLFVAGQGVSLWLGPDGLGQVERCYRTRVDVLYRRDGRLCRRRVGAAALAVWQDTHPLLFPCFNPLGRAIPPRPKEVSRP